MQPTNPYDQNNTGHVAEVIQKSSSGAIILPANPSPDAIAAATAMYLGLIKLGKNIAIVCDATPKSDLVGADKIQSQLATAGDNLVISFPYTDGAIDKVDYNIQGDVFNLVITPRPGQPKLNPQQVKYNYSGGTVDFIITIDAPNLHSLGKAYTENKNNFQGKNIINIDRHLVNDFFGTVNIVNKTASSTSELALQFLRDIESEIDRDMATNLYSGLSGATNSFTSYSVNAQTFETAAYLLKMGAIKKQVRRPLGVQSPISTQPQIPSPFPPRRVSPQQQPFVPRPAQTQQSAPQPVAPFTQPADPFDLIDDEDQEDDLLMPQPTPAPLPKQPIPSQPIPLSQQSQPIKQTHTNEQQDKPTDLIETEAHHQEGNEPSEDWLKPKIFRGTGLL